MIFISHEFGKDKVCKATQLGERKSKKHSHISSNISKQTKFPIIRICFCDLNIIISKVEDSTSKLMPRGVVCGNHECFQVVARFGAILVKRVAVLVVDFQCFGSYFWVCANVLPLVEEWHCAANFFHHVLKIKLIDNKKQ